MPSILNCIVNQFRGNEGYYQTVQKNIGVRKKQKFWEEPHHIEQVKKIVKRYDKKKSINENLYDAYINDGFKTGKDRTLKDITFDFSKHALGLSENTGQWVDGDNEVITFPDHVTLKDCYLSGGKMAFSKGSVTATGLLTQLDVLGEGAVGTASHSCSVVNAIGYKAQGFAIKDGAIANAIGCGTVVVAQVKGAKARAVGSGSVAIADKGEAYSCFAEATAIAVSPLSTATALKGDAVALAAHGGVAVAKNKGIAMALEGRSNFPGISRAHAEDGGVALAKGKNTLAVCHPGGVVLYEDQNTNVNFFSGNYSKFDLCTYQEKTATSGVKGSRQLLLPTNLNQPQLLTYIPSNQGACRIQIVENADLLEKCMNTKERAKDLVLGAISFCCNLPKIYDEMEKVGSPPNRWQDGMMESNQRAFLQTKSASSPDLLGSRIVSNPPLWTNGTFEAERWGSVNQGDGCKFGATFPSMVLPAGSNSQQNSAIFPNKTKVPGAVVGGMLLDDVERNVGPSSWVHRPEYDTPPIASAHSSSQRRLSTSDYVGRVQVNPVNSVSNLPAAPNTQLDLPQLDLLRALQQMSSILQQLLPAEGKEYPGYPFQENKPENYAFAALNIQGDFPLKGAQAIKPHADFFQQGSGYWQQELSGNRLGESQKNLESSPDYSRPLSIIESCDERGDGMVGESGAAEVRSLDSNVVQPPLPTTGCVNSSSYRDSDGKENNCRTLDFSKYKLSSSQPSSTGLPRMKMGVSSLATKQSNHKNLATGVWLPQGTDKSATEMANQRIARETTV